MRTKATALISAIIGGTVGAVAGVLFAPHKGSITRAKIKNDLDKKKEEATEKAMEYKDKAKAKIEQAR